MQPFKKIAIQAAQAAGKIQLKNFGKIRYVKNKGPLGLVTNVDFLCEKKITEIIKQHFPDHNILAEEFKYKKTNSEYKWLIDPIDGTHNYIYGIPHFGVSIALEFKSRIILGVIYLPFFKRLFIAEKGKGAFLNGKRISVSKRKQLKDALMQFDGSLGQQTKRKLAFLKKTLNYIFRVRISGCAVWDLTSVAMGKSDLCVSFSTHPWDVAAGFLIVEEAHGKITDFKGKKWSQYMHEFIATNSKIHNRAIRIVRFL